MAGEWRATYTSAAGNTSFRIKFGPTSESPISFGKGSITATPENGKPLLDALAENPKGDWIARKLFFATGDEAAEVFFNMNARTGEAEFAEKDADYGDDLLKAFSSVLQ